MTLAATLATTRPTGVRARDAYFAALLFAVAAYATVGKGFAYAGVAPIFPGEVLLAAGLLTLVLPFPSLAAFATLPSVLLVLLMVWTVARTAPFVAIYKIDALRDSVIVTYGLFAFVVANLVLEKPARIDKAVQWAGGFFTIYGSIIVLLYVFPKYFNALLPGWPGSGSPLIALRGGEVAVHAGGAAVFALLGLKRSTLPWVVMLVSAIVVVSAQSRGGMLAIAVPFGLAVLVTRRFRAPLLLLLVAVPIVTVLYVGDVEIPLQSDRRTVRVGQLLDNAASIFVSSAESSDKTLDDTKQWRLRWWDRIIGYTVHGDYFWTGKGFGIGLAADDGFAGTDHSGPPLRSPHSAHMTILARTGLPGLALWIAIGVAWLGRMARGIALARMRGDERWSHLLLFVTCYWLGCVVDSSFDVALEGPMLGIVFWVLFGAGIGLTMTYDALCRTRAVQQRAERSVW